MATITRNIRVTGSVMSSPVAATVLVNGVEVHSGQIGVGQPIDVPSIELFKFDFQGDDTVAETLAFSISVTSGVAKLSMTQALVNGEYTNVWGGNDGRTQILINGLAPEWPPTPVTPMPGGTPENPDWSGWAFDVSAGETMTYEYNLLPPPPTPPAA